MGRQGTRQAALPRCECLQPLPTPSPALSSLSSALRQHDPLDEVSHSVRLQRHVPGGCPQPLAYQRGHSQPLAHQRGHAAGHHPQLRRPREQRRAQLHGGVLLGGLGAGRSPLDSGTSAAANRVWPSAYKASIQHYWGDCALPLVLITSCFSSPAMTLPSKSQIWMLGLWQQSQ